MKFSLPRLLTITLSLLYSLAVAAQSSMNFSLTSVSYEIKAISVDDTHAKFAIGKSAAGAPAFTESLAFMGG